MILDILEDVNYRKMMEKQIKDIIVYLLKQDEEFSLTANIKGVQFNPKIPSIISDGFSKFTMFTLSGYTYSTITVSNDYISFEAGFGEENFGSLVTVPFYAIFQLVINDSILLVNPTATVDKYFLEENQGNNEENSQKRSKNAFSMNPKNKGLIK